MNGCQRFWTVAIVWDSFFQSATDPDAKSVEDNYLGYGLHSFLEPWEVKKYSSNS
ncbi:hypothetical protein RV11_GL003071 [Enterococcus phoeniculicola]|nr:hypothetical protein RV11_GL003071 [Enterococcus phoeniculicola]